MAQLMKVIGANGFKAWKRKVFHQCRHVYIGDYKYGKRDGTLTSLSGTIRIRGRIQKL